MNGRGLAAFAAGFGTGYLSNEQRKKELERQKKLDEIQLKKAGREEEEYERNKSVDQQADAVETKRYTDKRAMNADDVRQMTGGSNDPNSQNYVSDEAAQQYITNNTGAEQVSSNADYYTKNVVGAGLGTMKPIQEGAEVKLGDTATAKQKPLYKIMDEKADIRILSGVPYQIEIGKAAKALATQMKSQAALEGGMAALRKDGVPGLIKFMSNWDNDDYPINNIRMNKSENGATSFIGELNGKDIDLDKFDPAEQPKGMTIETWAAQKFQELVDQSAMFKNSLSKLAMAREDLRDTKAQENADRTFEYNKERDGVKDKQWKLSFDADQAQRSFDNKFKNKSFEADQQHRKDTLDLDRQKLDAKAQKTPESFRQDFNAALQAFDKSFKRDALGNIVGNEMDSKLYSQAADIMGKEIMNGAPISDAQAIARSVYDEAKKGKVSAQAAYDAIKARSNTAGATSKTAAGTAAVDNFFK